MWLISIYALNFGIKWLKLPIFGWKYHWKYITIYGTLKRICSILFIKARSFMLSEFLIKLYVFSCSEDSLGAKIIETITWVGDSYVEFCERLIMELTPWIYSLLLRFYYLWNFLEFLNFYFCFGHDFITWLSNFIFRSCVIFLLIQDFIRSYLWVIPFLFNFPFLHPLKIRENL